MGDAEIMAAESARWAEPDDGELVEPRLVKRCPDCDSPTTTDTTTLRQVCERGVVAVCARMLPETVCSDGERCGATLGELPCTCRECRDWERDE